MPEPLKKVGSSKAVVPPADVPPDVAKQQAVSAATTVEEGADLNYWWYCLEQDHPGVPTYTSQPFDLGRIFGTEDDIGCPTCPGCGREVSAIPCLGPKTPPAQILDYAKRFGAQQIVGGIAR